MGKSIKPDVEVLHFLNDYESFIDGQKSLALPISVTKIKPNHKSSLYYKDSIIASSPFGETNFDCEIRDKSKMDYSFQILSDRIQKKVLFRMDEGDGTHRNKFADTLSEESVPTPHFHRYDDQGRWYAYQTDELKNIQGHSVQIEEGFPIFCAEMNVTSSPQTIKIQEKNSLGLEMNGDIDPLDGVSFP